MVWRRTVCDIEINNSVIRKVQRVLKAKGYNPDAIDGIYGCDTRKALKAFQKANGLPSGYLTVETLRALRSGVAIDRMMALFSRLEF